MTPCMVDVERLYEHAEAARGRAYAPYSQFAVGAALLAGDGRIFTGANVENASYGLSMCAERSAVFAALGAGAREFAAIAVAGPAGIPTLPCGACRQVLAEFNPGLAIVYGGPDGRVQESLSVLLPHPFLPESLPARS